MSFSLETKKELCKNPWETSAQMRAECYGLLLFAKMFRHNAILLSTENKYVANRFINLLSDCFGVITEKCSTLTGKRASGHLFTISVPNPDECNKIFTYFGHSRDEINLRINRANIESEESMVGFLRGAFLCCGSVSDPAKDYHLEFSVPFKNLCGDLTKLISEMADYMQVPKITTRKGVYVAYLKDSEHISDFIAFIGAPLASMQIMNEKIVKEIRNNANRKTNSEVANMKKTINASMEQIKAIEKIQCSIGLETLSDDLHTLALLRLEQPEASLRDLGEQLKPPISRSGVNHRMKKIMDMAEKI